MLRTIISKELLLNIFNLRFIVGLLLCVIITISCVVILTNRFQREYEDYSTRISLQDDFLNNYAHTNRISGMIAPQRPPEQFRPLVIGLPQDTDIGSFNDNPLPVLFPHIDLIFIVTIIMSLLAILFSYDSITGEREKGMLRLITSNSLSRATVLFGKWVGGIISLIIPFVFSLLAGVLVVNIHPLIQWDASYYLSFGLLLLASITFISVFYLMGLLVSAFSRYSSVSILTALFIWILLILVIPNLSPYVSAQFYPVPSVNRIEREVSRLRGVERDNLGMKLSGEVTEKFQQEYGTLFTEYQEMNQDKRKQRIASDQDFSAMNEAYREAFQQAWGEANRIQREKAEDISAELNAKTKVQTVMAKNIACISPYANFVYIATDLTGTGLRSLDYFSRMRGEYLRAYYDYQNRTIKEILEKDPTYDTTNGFIDISDRPRFSFGEEPLKERFYAVMPYWGLLLFFNVLFFAGAFVKFIRYDVR